MKRVLLVVLTALIMLSFCVHSYAANVTVYNKVNSGRTVNGVVISATACAYKTNAEGILLMQNNSSSYVPVLVNIQITNATDSAQLIQNLAFSIEADSPIDAGIYNIENFSKDLTLTHDTNVYGTFSVVPSNDFSYNNGIIVPSHSSLYLVSEVQIWREYNPTNQAFVNFQLNSITITSAVTATNTDATAGEPVDLSPVISAINDLDTTVEDNLSTIESIVTTIKNNTDNIVSVLGQIAAKFNGTTHNFSISGVPFYSEHKSLFNDGGVAVYADEQLYTDLIEFEYDINNVGNQNNAHMYTIVDNVVEYILSIRNVNQVSYTLDYSVFEFFVTPTMGGTYVSSQWDVPYSDLPYVITVNNYNRQRVSFGVEPNNTNRLILPANSYIKFVIRKHYYRLYDSVSINPNIDYTFSNVMRIEVADNHQLMKVRQEQYDLYSYNNGKVINDIKSKLYQIYEDISNVNETDTASSSAGLLNNSVSTVHQQEEQFYAQNSQALESSGITHYSFDNGSTSALNVARTLFEKLWIALNPYTIVYTFSMLLTLALAIIRYTNSRKAKKE